MDERYDYPMRHMRRLAILTGVLAVLATGAFGQTVLSQGTLTSASANVGIDVSTSGPVPLYYTLSWSPVSTPVSPCLLSVASIANNVPTTIIAAQACGSAGSASSVQVLAGRVAIQPIIGSGSVYYALTAWVALPITGSASLSGMSSLGVPIAATATTVTSSTTAGTNRGSYYVGRLNTSQGTATTPVEVQAGVCNRSLSGTATDSILYTDVLPCTIIHARIDGNAVTETIPTPTSLNNSNAAFIYQNDSAQSDTLTPTTWQIALGHNAAAATLTVPANTKCTVQVDPTVASVWDAACYPNSTGATINTATKCGAAGSAANPSLVACAAAPAGHFSCASNASAGTCVVSTTAVTANSVIHIQPESGTAANTATGVTCNSTADSSLTTTRIASWTAATSFTINLGTYSGNECFSYVIVN